MAWPMKVLVALALMRRAESNAARARLKTLATEKTLASRTRPVL